MLESRFRPEHSRSFDSLDAFKQHLTTPIPQDGLKELRENYRKLVRIREEDHRKRPIEELQAIGAHPIETPYDALKSHFLMPEVDYLDALVRTYVHLWTLIHPARIEAMIALENAGYKPVERKVVPVLDRASGNNHSLTFGDLGFRPRPVAQDDRFEDSARAVLAQGLFTWGTNNMVTIPYWLGSMPDMISADSLADLAIAGGIGFVPVDSIYTDPKNQVLMLREAHLIILDHPVLRDHPYKDVIAKNAMKRVGVTLKTSNGDLRRRAEIAYAEGARTFRLYDPRSLPRLEESVDELRQRYGNEIIIIAGQVTGVDQAHRLAEKGANAVNTGIGEGGICKTPTEASVTPTNLQTLYEIAASGLPIPVGEDGGVGTDAAIVFAVGGRFVIKSQSIGTGITQPPGRWVCMSPSGRGRYAKNYSGEAAPRTKYNGHKTDMLDDPLFVEGADEYVELNLQSPGVPSNVYFALQGLATNTVFARSPSLTDLQMLESPDLWTESHNAAISSGIHHNGVK